MYSNRVALDAELAPGNSYEGDLAARHLTHTTGDDIVVYDRGYCSFKMFALASLAPGDFVIRCHGQSFTVVNEMLAGRGSDDIICTIQASKPCSRNQSNQHLLRTLEVRFVRVQLDTGEYEVLATSLFDRAMYPRTVFKELYRLRWGVETFYGILKTRLVLENFSGLSAEAVLQDFHATILLTGIESILTEDAEDQLKRQRGGRTKKVNKAVSFNAIKYRAFELFLSGCSRDETLGELTDLFVSNPTLVRPERNPPRHQRATRQLLGFWKRRRKMVF